MSEINNTRDTLFPTGHVVYTVDQETRVGTLEVTFEGGKNLRMDSLLAQYKTEAEQEVANFPRFSTWFEDNMNLIGVDTRQVDWSQIDTLNIQGSNFAEQMSLGTIPSGKTVNLQTGVRRAEYDALKQLNVLSGDAVFADLETGAALNIEGDSVAGRVFENEGIPLGSKHQLVVTGNGTVTGDLGRYGNNVFIEAAEVDLKIAENAANAKKGADDSRGYAEINALKAALEGGFGPDEFKFNMEKATASTPAEGEAEGKAGSTENSDTDNMSVYNIPNGSTAKVTVNELGSSGTFKDAGFVVDIQNAAGQSLGQYTGKDVNAVFLTNESGQTTVIVPANLGNGGSRDYDLGGSADKRSASVSEKDEKMPVRSATELPPVEGAAKGQGL